MADQGSIALLSEHLLGLLRQNQEHPGAFEPAATGGKAGPLGMGGEYAGPLDNGSGLWGSSLWSNGPGANIWAANAAGKTRSARRGVALLRGLTAPTDTENSTLN